MSSDQPRRDHRPPDPAAREIASPVAQETWPTHHYPAGYQPTPEELELDALEHVAERDFADYWGGQGETWEAQAAENSPSREEINANDEERMRATDRQWDEHFARRDSQPAASADRADSQRPRHATPRDADHREPELEAGS